ncbi:uncharacterized protein TRUGW13939_07615 [Talaromyces rugulosus]|uniref:Uncharacterized protein n=1 Tax=Talaromyces rugulosus TaxID=121627 RepID=A0A7H8R266_TALRU|nr:uncharacterized protein TRUGW13939_07615 [Talaromyces rugulosus]QKX60470.1 hypothetical protein TRUGW13939_07615 [Talaromyces rugulosus]
MDTPMTEADRTAAIDQLRKNVFSRTSLTFLPHRQDRFMEDYSDLPGGKSMSIRNRIKLIPDNYQRKFLRRVETVVQHSRQALLDHFSEFNWEADAWRDIFGRLRDDERLRMDKREYNYKATILDNVEIETSRYKNLIYMGKIIPDITFGLSVYESGDPEDEGVDERERRIRRSLEETQLGNNIWELDGLSLVTDPKWGEHTLLFPFAVYEAKKDEKSEVQVKLQLKLAFNTYLQMLDNLVRQPGKKEYQSPESRIFPIFGFTSSGSMWKMYVGYLPNCFQNDPDSADDPLCDDDSHMKLIWWGDTCNRQHAGELIDMIDQIHEYAVTSHRPFVASHIDDWKVFMGRRYHKWIISDGFDPADSGKDVEPGWYSVKRNGMEVRKLLKAKRKKGMVLTDDELKRSVLETRLNEAENTKTGGSPRRRGRPRKVQKIK